MLNSPRLSGEVMCLRQEKAGLGFRVEGLRLLYYELSEGLGILQLYTIL